MPAGCARRVQNGAHIIFSHRRLRAELPKCRQPKLFRVHADLLEFVASLAAKTGWQPPCYRAPVTGRCGQLGAQYSSWGKAGREVVGTAEKRPPDRRPSARMIFPDGNFVSRRVPCRAIDREGDVRDWRLTGLAAWSAITLSRNRVSREACSCRADCGPLSRQG